MKLCQNGPNNSCNATLACPTCAPVILGPTWFGTGGMVNWTNDASADYWHDLKRQPLINMGVMGHWIDLREPRRITPRIGSSGCSPASMAKPITTICTTSSGRKALHAGMPATASRADLLRWRAPAPPASSGWRQHVVG